MRTTKTFTSGKTWGLVGAVLCVLLVGTEGWGLAAVWDEGCEQAIGQLQHAQQTLANQYEEYQTAKLSMMLPQDFLKHPESSPEERLDTYSQVAAELNTYIKKFNFQLSAFNQACLQGESSP